MSERSLKAPPPAAYEAAVTDRIVALIGLDPRETLDKLRDAQQATSNLRREEAKLVALLASYEARYGYPSHWEHERKALLARLASHQRDKILLRGEKPTESMLDEYAHAHGEYRSFLVEAQKERAEMERLRADVARIQAEIETARAAEVYFERHARLNDALVFHSARELGL